MDQEESLDLLDLDTDNEVDALPEAVPFTSPRPKKPWLLMGLGVLVVVLATWIIIATVGKTDKNTIDIDFDTPAPSAEVVDNTAPVPDLNVPSKPVESVPEQKVEEKPVEKSEPAPAVKPEPVAEKPVETNGAPIRVIEDRKDVVFNPDKPSVEAKPVKKTIAPAKKTVSTKPVASSANGSIYVQFGSYSTREAAQSAERKIRANHSGLFAGKQFVILAAVVKGKTTYRLRVPFHSVNDANGFCRNAKSDGLDCYVAK